MQIADYHSAQPSARRPREKNDDLFSRRLSDSNRRNSLTPIPQVSIITTPASVVETQEEIRLKANTTPSSSVSSTSSSSQPYCQSATLPNASARLKARLHADDSKSKPSNNSTSHRARVSNLLVIINSTAYDFHSNQILFARPRPSQKKAQPYLAI